LRRLAARRAAWRSAPGVACASMAASPGVACHVSPPCQSRSGAARGDDRSLNCTKELVHVEVEHRPPLELLADLRQIEQKILQGDRGAGGDAAIDKDRPPRPLPKPFTPGGGGLSPSPTSEGTYSCTRRA
jgi:hypothetical protein